MFKVGDRVNHPNYGWGTIVEIRNSDVQPYLVKYDEYNMALHSGGYRYNEGHCWYYKESEILNIIEKEKGEKIMINYEDILRIYKDRKRAEYIETRDKKQEEYKDAYSKLRDEYNEKLLELLKKDNKESSYGCYKLTGIVESEARREEYKKINDEYYKEQDKLDKLIREVEAQLKLCSTREETLEVLKLYKIVDESGKIYGCEE